jgi:hypothetical protein
MTNHLTGKSKTPLQFKVFHTLLGLAVFFSLITIPAEAQVINIFNMPMAGDDKALTVTSTRAILINASKSDVWKWLIQLGADRCGFYSYEFIEKILGYETRHQNLIRPEFKKIVVGDLVRGSINERSSIIPYNFRVLYVKSE